MASTGCQQGCLSARSQAHTALSCAIWSGMAAASSSAPQQDIQEGLLLSFPVLEITPGDDLISDQQLTEVIQVCVP